MDKSKCKRCGAEILIATAKANEGLCTPCSRGTNKKFDAEQDPRYASLVAQFRSLNCKYPERYARTEISQGTPELSTFNFIRELWQLILPRGAPHYLKGCGRMIEGHPFGPPLEGDGAFERLQASNADMNDIVEVARHAQISVLLGVAALLDTVSRSGPMCPDASWGLYEQSEDDSAGRRLDSLHEVILDDGFVESLTDDDEQSTSTGSQ